MFADHYVSEVVRVVWGDFLNGKMVHAPDGWEKLAQDQKNSQDVLQAVCSSAGYRNYLRYRHCNETVKDIDRAFEESRRVRDMITDLVRAYVLENGIRLSPDHEAWFLDAYLEFKGEEGVTYTMEEKQVLWASVDALLEAYREFKGGDESPHRLVV